MIYVHQDRQYSFSGTDGETTMFNTPHIALPQNFGSLTMPAGTLVRGNIIEVVAMGWVYIPAAETRDCTVRLKLGGYSFGELTIPACAGDDALDSEFVVRGYIRIEGEAAAGGGVITMGGLEFSITPPTGDGRFRSTAEFGHGLDITIDNTLDLTGEIVSGSGDSWWGPVTIFVRLLNPPS